jgi:hypothetical protein
MLVGDIGSSNPWGNEQERRERPSKIIDDTRSKPTK